MNCLRMIGIALLIAVPAATARAQTSPTDFIRAKVDEVVAIVNRDVQQGTEAFRQRQEDLKAAVRGFLDYRELCIRALGDHWNERTPEQQDAFVELMTRLIETNYAVKLGDEHLDSDFQVNYEDEIVRGDNAMVTGTVTYEDEVVAVEVMLMRRDDNWLVWDVVTDDVSIQETYAESFDEIITEDGWDELIRRLQERLDELQTELDEQMNAATPATASD